MNTGQLTPRNQSFQILSRDFIKYIAMFTMLLNHTALILLTPGTMLREFLEDIGYFTGITMCYFLVEGYAYTRSKKKYALRLFLFAVISQLQYALYPANLLSDSVCQGKYPKQASSDPCEFSARAYDNFMRLAAVGSSLHDSVFHLPGFQEKTAGGIHSRLYSVCGFHAGIYLRPCLSPIAGRNPQPFLRCRTPGLRSCHTLSL